MEIAQTATESRANAAAPAPPTQKISSDFETFLRMLTVQMQNQDPLNPVDSSDYAVQLATFSGVEQAVLTNDLLKNLTAQLNISGLADIASWVGKEVRAAAPAYFDGAPVILAPNPAMIADRAQIVVSTETGVEVQRIDIPATTETVEWAGVGPGGAPFAPGVYTFKLVSLAGGQEVARDPIDVYSKVTEIRVQGGQTMLILDGGVEITSAQVSALRNPS
ncbi:flagellar hook capping FlgD N-terminal domain-containing protein [Yoonia sp.]|uniref:flagellar hook capping FlgD N-terminal domain-containing protein n=1 Tax=Yoonia sp. TaxID=2212373 RepID=UPI0019DD9300|nr:flagellar hook capping FlgD N-terminal domain-containing protein [Yoonia sp.]MBE0413768.1 flagellar hook assembly protein FlgD [Yoonia sp.]